MYYNGGKGGGRNFPVRTGPVIIVIRYAVRSDGFGLPLKNNRLFFSVLVLEITKGLADFSQNDGRLRREIPGYRMGSGQFAAAPEAALCRKGGGSGFSGSPFCKKSNGGANRMNGINSVRITVNGVNYTINTVEPEEYVQKLADELNGAVSEIRDKNSTISFNDIMVLCAINYIDAYKRSEENADRMRTQISEYLEDAAKARIELDEVRRENAHLRRQLSGKETKGQIKDPKA